MYKNMQNENFYIFSTEKLDKFIQNLRKVFLDKRNPS